MHPEFDDWREVWDKRDDRGKISELEWEYITTLKALERMDWDK